MAQGFVDQARGLDEGAMLMANDAFISYSHAADEKLAPTLERGLL